MAANKLNEIIDLISTKLDVSHGIGDMIRYRYVYKYLPNDTGKCLDVGCGGGHFFKFIKQRGYIPFGIDLDHSSEKMNIKRGDMGNVPYKNDFFDAIVSIDSLYLEPGDAFKEFYRVLKPNGVIIIHAPLPNSEQKNILIDEPRKELNNKDKSDVRPRTHWEKRHRQWYKKGELASIAKTVGFRDIEEYPVWGFFETLAYDLDKRFSEHDRRIRTVASLLLLFDDEPIYSNKKQPVGLITRFKK